MNEISNILSGRVEGTKLPGVYKIESLRFPGKIYIGSSGNIKQRHSRHLKDLRRNIHPNAKLQNHYNKYGEDDLIFTILVICPLDEILLAEQSFIDWVHPWFNLSLSAFNTAGIIRSEETRRKISESQLGRIPWNKGLTKETSEIISLCIESRAKSYRKEDHPNYGKHLSEETRAKISESNKGKSRKSNNNKSYWTKGNIPWNKGKGGYKCKPPSEGGRRNMSNAAKRRGISKEQLERMAEGRRRNRALRKAGKE